MFRPRSVIAGLRALFRKQQVEREIDEELRAYLEDAVQDKMRRGMSREAALREARLEMGSVDEVKDQIRSVGWEARLATLPARLKEVRMLKPRLITSSAIVMAALTLAGWWGISSFWLAAPLGTPTRFVGPGSSGPSEALMLYMVTEDPAHFGFSAPRTVDAQVKGPVPISMPPIRYTPEAKSARVKGTIVAGFDVGSGGNVLGVKITAVSLSPKQSAGLEESVLSAVRAWKFKPATRKGKPVPLRVYLAVNFRPAEV